MKKLIKKTTNYAAAMTATVFAAPSLAVGSLETKTTAVGEALFTADNVDFVSKGMLVVGVVLMVAGGYQYITGAGIEKAKKPLLSGLLIASFGMGLTAAVTAIIGITPA